MLWYYMFYFKQKTAYEMRIRDWSSDVCSSDLLVAARVEAGAVADLDGSAQGAGEEPAFGADVDDPGGAVEHDALHVGLRQVLGGGAGGDDPAVVERSEARRVGTECVSKCRSRLPSSH